MNRARARRFSLGVIASAAVALAAGGGCERVAYYSSTEGGGDPAPTTTTAVATTTATGTGTTSTFTPKPVTRARVLESIGVCAASLYGEAAAAADKLRAATAAAAADPSKKEEARAAWNDAIDLWQQTEMIAVGPAGPATVPGGKGLRDVVYSWPLVSRCLVEQQIVSKAYEKSDFFSVALLNMRGLAAAEYLLFYGGADNACSSSSSINTQGTWAALGEAELAKRKAAYASVLGDDVAKQLGVIAGGWSASGGNFASELANAGKSGALFETDQLAMNAVTDGLFYLEKGVRDLKIGRPLGLLECDTATCPELVESLFARRSRDHIKNNLIGFRRVFAGCAEGEDVGLDDLLAALGAGDLAARMTADTDAAIAAADALPSSDVAVAILQDPAKVLALHAAIKKITNELKTQFATVLDVELPKTVEGDND